MDSVAQLAQLLEGLCKRLPSLAQHRCRGLRIALELRLGQAEGHRDRDEPLLRAVVEVALDSPPLRFRRLDQTRPRGLQLTELRQ
jgi:hypothetical protein